MTLEALEAVPPPARVTRAEWEAFFSADVVPAIDTVSSGTMVRAFRYRRADGREVTYHRRVPGGDFHLSGFHRPR